MEFRGRAVTPARVLNAVTSRVRYNFVRPVVGAVPRFVFGNDAGLSKNLLGRRELSQAQRALQARGVTPPEHPRAEQFRRQGFVPIDPRYPAGLIDRVRRRYAELIQSDDTSTFNGVGRFFEASRALKDPLRDLPAVKELFTDEVQTVIRAYYRSELRVLHVRAWRTRAVDGVDLEADAYSNQWHNDHEPVWMVRLFVYLNDGVTRETGAFRVHSVESTRDIMRSGFIRRSTVIGSASGKLNDESRIHYFEGDAGAACLCNVQQCLHRAGVPRSGSQRDIVQITVAPSTKPFTDWTGVGSG